MKQEIKINFNDLNSIKKAEIKKTYLENKGFIQKDIKKIGFDKVIITYGGC